MVDHQAGDGGKPRIFALIIDNVAATVIAIAAAASVPSPNGVVRGTVCCAAYLCYYFISEGIWGRTLGKLFTGLVVYRLDGVRAGWTESAIRTLLRVLEVNPILLGAVPGGLVVVFSRRKQRLGDVLARTVVIRIPRDAPRWPSSHAVPSAPDVHAGGG